MSLNFLSLASRFTKSPDWNRSSPQADSGACKLDISPEKIVQFIVQDLFRILIKLPAERSSHHIASLSSSSGKDHATLLVDKRPHSPFIVAINIAGTEVVKFVFTNKRYSPDHSFALTHRVVRKRLRGYGIGTAVLSACEDYLRSTGVNEIKVNTSQLSVICWLHNRGYTPHDKPSNVGLRDILSHADTPRIGGILLAGPNSTLPYALYRTSPHFSECRLTLSKRLS